MRVDIGQAGTAWSGEGMRITSVRRQETSRVLPPIKSAPRWLRSHILRLLDYLKQYEDRVDVSVVYNELDIEKLSEAIIDEWDYVDQMHGNAPTRLVIGCDKWDEVCGEIEQYMRLHVDFNIAADNRRFHGMNVEVVPWVNGFVVLP